MRKVLLFLSIFLSLLIPSCKKDHTHPDYRNEMRMFVESISAYAKTRSPGFIVIPQNGHALLTDDGTKTGTPVANYISAIDGVGREDLFYGFTGDDIATPEEDKNEMLGLMDVAKNNGLKVLATDYCFSAAKVDDSYSQNESRGYISFAANHRGLDNIPQYPLSPRNVNTVNIDSLYKAKNFLYLIDPYGYETKGYFIQAISQTDFDVVIIDMSYSDFENFDSLDIALMKQKASGGTRKVICYMSIGEAEDYRYYWKSYWKTNPPDFLVAENPAWGGNYKVKYWDKNWQDIIYGNNSSYLKKIMDAGFDGVYLDIIDAYEFFEDTN